MSPPFILIMRLFDKVEHQIPNWRIFFLFSILILVAYCNSFQASWQLDDKPNILKNHRIQLNQLSLPHILQTAFAKPGSGEFYRPVACLTLALNWYFGQKNVFGYHVVNFLIHFCTAWLLFLTIKILFNTPRLRDRYGPTQIDFIAVMATLFWALNPIHVQAVTYIVQRMASMAAMFSLLAIFFYLKARLSTDIKKRTSFLVCALISYLLALLSKENAITVILTLPVFELIFFHHTLSRSLIYKTIVAIIVGCIISLLAALALQPDLFDFIINYYNNRPFTLNERFLTEQRIVLFYITQLFFPAPGRLSVEHDITLSTSFMTPWTTGAAITVNLLFILLAIKVSRKQPLLSLAIFFFFFNHLVESTIVPLELIFEHRNYLPALFLFLPIAQAFNWLVIKAQVNKILIAFIIVLFAFMLAAEGYATYERNKAWKTEESLWLDAMVKAPNSSRPLGTLAIKLAWGPNPTEGKYRKALELIERTLSMRMNRSRLVAAQLGNMASIYNKLGENNKAIVYYKKALAVFPENVGLRYNLCKALIMTGNFLQGKDELMTILDKGFIHADYFNMLGFIYLWTGQSESALPALHQAMKYAPGRPDILLTLANCLSQLGYHNKAKWYLSLARKNGGNDAVISLCMIENALAADNIILAQEELKRAINKFPLAHFLRPLHALPDELYREVPFASGILIPFIQSELLKISDQLIMVKRGTG